MANNNRNQGDQSYEGNQDWNQNNRRSNEEGNQNRENYGRMNDNRGNEDQFRGGGNERYSQSAGQNDRNQGGYGDMRHVEYGDVYRGNVERREEETNRAQGGIQNIYNERDKDPRLANRGHEQNRNRGREDDSRYRNNSGSNYGGGYNPGNAYNASRQGIMGSNEDRNYGNRDQHGDSGNWWNRTKEEVSSWFGGNEDDRNRDRGIRGEHKGKGPKGYKRSDERIREDLHDRLYEDPYVDASNIEVQVEGGEVVLTGTVTSKDQKRRAEDVADAISGVNNVENRIRVGQTNTASSGTQRSGTDTNKPEQRHVANVASEYTGTSNDVGGVGNETGTTNEIIRKAGNMNTE